MPQTIIDITRPLAPETPAWPGDTALTIAWTTPHAGNVAAVSALTLSPHLGTHLDAPLHLDANGGDAATLPLGPCIGPCTVVELHPRPGPIHPSDLPDDWRPRPRVLVKTGAWPVGTPLPERFPSLSPDLVDRLADLGVQLVGIDTPSVDAPDASALPAHTRCLERGLVILEGADLSGVRPGAYTLVALPLRLAGVEASPVRAVLLPRV